MSERAGGGPPEKGANAGFAARTVTAAAIVLATVLAALAVALAASGFLLVFAGALLAAIFCGLADLLRRLGLPRRVALSLVYLLFIALLAAPATWGGVALAQQFNALVQGVRTQAEGLLRMLADMGLPVLGGEPASLQEVLPDPSGLFSSASQALLAVLGGLGNLFVILFLGIFVSWQPELYRDGVVSLVPKGKRARFADVLRQAAHALIMWVAGAAVAMATVFVVSWLALALIGMPNAFLLSVQAGVLAFIPTVGPFVGGVVIVLAGLADGAEMALWGLGVYLLIQGVESNITTPIAQRWTTALPPALTLGFQIVFGLLFGLLGFVLAVPLLAVLLVLVRELYVIDVLGGPAGETK